MAVATMSAREREGEGEEREKSESDFPPGNGTVKTIDKREAKETPIQSSNVTRDLQVLRSDGIAKHAKET